MPKRKDPTTDSLVATIYGTMKLPAATDDLISRSLKMLGEWAYAESLLIAPMINPGDRVYDVGAYLGTFSLGLAGLATLGEVVAVEANPLVAPLLKTNLLKNANLPVRVVNKAVSQTNGWMQVENTDGTNLGATKFVTSKRKKGAIASQSLACLRAAYGDYDVLKLDIEGQEVPALLGDGDFLRSRKPLVWVECNESKASLDLYDVLRGFGYKPAYVAFPAFRRRNNNNSTNLIYPLAYEAALVAAPPAQMKRLTCRVEGEDIIYVPLKNSSDLRLALWNTPRWCHQSWENLSFPELIAKCGRYFLEQDYGTFI